MGGKIISFCVSYKIFHPGTPQMSFLMMMKDVEERMNHRTEDVLEIFDSVKHIFDQDNVNQDEIVKISETEETVVSNLTKRQNLTKRFRHSFRKKMSQLKIRHKDSENPH